MSTVLEIAQEVSDRIGVARPTSLINSTDVDSRQLKSLLNKSGQLLLSDYDWNETLKEFQITLVNGVKEYSLPSDFLRIATATPYDDNNYQPMIGGLSPIIWTSLVKGLATANPYRNFRIAGVYDAKFQLVDAPTSSEAGNVLSFQYYSKNWMRPVLWSSESSFSSGEYCFNDGIYYQSDSTGITGTVAPTHTSGTAVDGDITWTADNFLYDKILMNSDVPLLPEDVLLLQLEWRWRRAKGFDFIDQMKEADNLTRTRSGSLKAAPILNLSRRRLTERYPINVPSTGFGGI